MVVTTYHCIERIKERCGIKSEETIRKNIAMAMYRGKCAEDFSGRERAYLTEQCRDEYSATAYNGFCYIFSEGRFCVTVYPLPKWFDKHNRFDGKERIRNQRKYWRNNPYADVYAA